jgi:hypothetical protein
MRGSETQIAPEPLWTEHYQQLYREVYHPAPSIVRPLHDALARPPSDQAV